MEENSYVKRQRFYKGIMLVLLTAFITFILTSIFISNQFEKDGTTNNSITSIFQGSSSLQKSLETIEDLINDKYLYEIDEKKSIEGAIEGYVASLGDPYTQYVPADEMEEYTEAIMGNYVGIGIYMTINTEKNLIQVIAPIRESPAEEAGIKSGDFITKINGENYTGDDLTKASNVIKGEEGTKVTLEILRGYQTLNIEVERRNINTNPVYEDIVDGDIGYLGITSFDEGVAEDFKNKFLDLKEKGIKSLIIDLRDNGGGIVEEATQIIDYIVPKGKDILITVDKDKNEEITKTKEDVLIDMPIVVLVNASSASASEIVAGALKDLDEATIVGSKTYGKGVIQEFLSLSNGGGLKITIEEYYTPNRTKINGVGITPDVEIELETSVTGLPTDTNDTQLNKAKEILHQQ